VGKAIHVRAAGKPELARRNSFTTSSGPSEDAFVLTPKNVQSLRTLFNVAHRLDHHLGTSWFMVLQNLNNLDKILHSPRTTTQVPPSWLGVSHSLLPPGALSLPGL